MRTKDAQPQTMLTHIQHIQCLYGILSGTPILKGNRSPMGTRNNAYLTIENGLIKQIGPMADAPTPHESDVVVDARDGIVLPCWCDVGPNVLWQTDNTQDEQAYLDKAHHDLQFLIAEGIGAAQFKISNPNIDPMLQLRTAQALRDDTNIPIRITYAPRRTKYGQPPIAPSLRLTVPSLDKEWDFKELDDLSEYFDGKPAEAFKTAGLCMVQGWEHLHSNPKFSQLLEVLIQTEAAWVWYPELGAELLKYLFDNDAVVALATQPDTKNEQPNCSNMSAMIQQLRNAEAYKALVDLAQILGMACYNGAYALGCHDIVGSIAEGKLANVMIADDMDTLLQGRFDMMINGIMCLPNSRDVM